MSRQMLFFWVFFASLISGSVADAEPKYRTWVDESGKFKVVARFVSEKDGVVTLKIKGGNSASLPIKLLSQDDRDYIKKLTGAKPETPPIKGGETTPATTSEPKKVMVEKPKPKYMQLPEGIDPVRGTIEMEDYWAASPINLDDIPVGKTWTVNIQGTRIYNPEEPRVISTPGRADEKFKPGQLVASPNHRYVIVTRQIDRDENKVRDTLVALVDLERGKVTGQGLVKGLWVPLDLNEDGKTFLMRSNRWEDHGLGDLQILTFDNGDLESQATWVPYMRSEDNRDIKAAWFVGKDQIATYSNDQRLLFWSMPNIKPVARIQLELSAVPAVAPGRMYVAYSSKYEVGLIDVQTHQVKSRIKTPQMHGDQLTFSPSGKLLASLGRDGIRVWDVASSNLYRDMKFDGISGWNEKPTWIDDDHLLIGPSVLIDLKNELQLWTFGNAHAATGGNGYGWFLVDDSETGKSGLMGRQLPHAQAEQVAASKQELDNFYLLRPTDPVCLKLSGVPEKSKAKELREKLEERLRIAGFQIADAAKVTVVAKIVQEKQQTAKYRKTSFQLANLPLASRGETITATYTPFTMTLEILREGEPVSTESKTTSQPGFVRLKDGQSFQNAVNEQNKPDYKFFDKAKIPKRIIRPRSDDVYTLGSSDLSLE